MRDYQLRLLLFFDESSGIKISLYVKNSQNLAHSNPSSPKSLEAVSSIMKKIHSSPKHFLNRFDWQNELAKYEQLIEQLSGSFFFDYTTLKEQLVTFVQENIKDPIWAPCHNDTVPENFILDDAGKTYLIDWEYSGMNDPCWTWQPTFLNPNYLQRLCTISF